MSSNSPDIGRPRNPTHFGGGGLYDPPGSGEASSLRVRLGDHLDSATKRTLLSGEQPATRMFRGFRRNPVAAAAVVGGLVWLLATLTRRSMR